MHRWTVGQAMGQGAGKQFSAALDGRCAIPIGEEAVVANAHEAGWQDVHQEAAAEHERRQGHGLGGVPVGVGLVEEAHPPAVEQRMREWEIAPRGV